MQLPEDYSKRVGMAADLLTRLPHRSYENIGLDLGAAFVAMWEPRMDREQAYPLARKVLCDASKGTPPRPRKCVLCKVSFDVPTPPEDYAVPIPHEGWCPVCHAWANWVEGGCKGPDPRESGAQE